MVQKFTPYTFVRIADKMPDCMRHFECGCDAIVHGTYAQLCHGSSERDFQLYSLYLIQDGKIWNRVSWYGESQLTALPDQSFQKAFEMEQEYLSKHLNP